MTQYQSINIIQKTLNIIITLAILNKILEVLITQNHKKWFATKVVLDFEESNNWASKFAVC